MTGVIGSFEIANTRYPVLVRNTKDTSIQYKYFAQLFTENFELIIFNG